VLTRTTDAGEAATLQAAGARLVRKANEMGLDFEGLKPDPAWTTPALPAGLRLTAVDRPAADLVEPALAAYSSREATASEPAPAAWVSVRAYQRILGGEVAGPLLRQPSALLVDESSAKVAGAALVTYFAANSWWDGGPLVADLFVVPRLSGMGLGRKLLQRAIARSVAAGARRIGLTVSEGIPAQSLYRSLGFERRRTVFVLALPEAMDTSGAHG
jgi:ribosomal protein S18 acetylase RimI-like enzyme